MKECPYDTGDSEEMIFSGRMGLVEWFRLTLHQAIHQATDLDSGVINEAGAIFCESSLREFGYAYRLKSS